jgi:hypothetical protein
LSDGAAKGNKELAMPWYFYPAYFLAGAFLANSVPHFVQGVCGNKFQTPFAKPPGIGESSATVNVIWGWLNFIIAGAIVEFFFPPLPLPGSLCGAAALGALVLSVLLANHFGKVRSSSPHP